MNGLQYFPEYKQEKSQLIFSLPVGGLHCDFIMQENSNLGVVLSSDILSYALSDGVKVGVTFGGFSGTSYTGVLPAESLRFGTWEINKRNSGSVSIKCQDIDNNTIWTNTHANNTWKGWVSYVKSSDLIREGAKTIIHQTNAGGSWSSALPVIKMESAQGVDQAICLTSMSTKSGALRLQTHMNGDFIAFRFINNDGTIKAVYKIDASNKTTGWEVL